MVVSLVNISPTHGSRYYTQEGNSELEQASQWSGNLAQTLGLSSAVESQPLTHLLQGKSPTGETLVNKTQLHRQQDNARQQGKTIPVERAGLDLTSSTPKSVSLQALVFGDVRLEQAHRQANDQMLQFLEENYACTRIRQQGQRVKVQTGQLAIAQFHHHTSRALDPQLHTHNLILNLQQRPDGKWQSLDNKSIYRARSRLGKLYRSELARAVEALGYTIEVTDSRHEFWELQGYSRQQLEQFSKRTQQIQAVAGADASSEQKAWITMTSGRQAKKNLPPSMLLDLWQQEASAAGITPINPVTLIQVGQNSRSHNQSNNSPSPEPHDFQRNENQISAASTAGSTRQHDSQPACLSHTEVRFDRTPIAEFRVSLRAIVRACEAADAPGCLGRLEPATPGNRRSDGATAALAEANAALPNYPPTDVGDSAATARWDVYLSDDGDSGVGYSDGEIDAEPNSEADATDELELDYRSGA